MTLGFLSTIFLSLLQRLTEKLREHSFSTNDAGLRRYAKRRREGDLVEGGKVFFENGGASFLTSCHQQAWTFLGEILGVASRPVDFCKKYDSFLQGPLLHGTDMHGLLECI